MQKHEEVTQILRKNRKRLECSEYLFAEDSNLKPYNNEKLKVLTLFLSTGRYRSSSNTFNALHSIAVKSTDVFMDYCFFPYGDDISVYDSLNIPYIRGARSGFLLEDFDIVLVSVAVLKEIVNLPVIYIHDNIPLGYYGRLKESTPLIVMGGSSASVLSIAWGKFTDGDIEDISLVDAVNLGKGERSLQELFCVAKSYKNMYGDINSHKEEILSSLSNRFLIPKDLRFSYDLDGTITKELSGNYCILDTGDSIEENFSDKILNLDGSFCDRGDLLISSGCSGQGSCSFCLEGNIGGCWKEKSITYLENDILELKSNVWCESIGIFSYNANYHTNISPIASLTKKYFNRSSLLASRADVYASQTEFLDICKSLGTIRLSIASEGMSDRLRNQFLNKRLSREDFYKAVENIMGNKILTLKINYILTGKETENDFNEFLEDMEYFTAYKKEHKFSTRLSVTITNLVIYDFTPLRYEKRDMALHSLNYDTSPFIQTFLSYVQKIKKLGINITLYGVGGVSTFEQLLLDLTFNGTQILIDSVKYDGIRYDRDITKAMCESFFQRVEKYLPIENILSERPKDYWFPSSLVRYGTFTQKNTGVLDSYKNLRCEACVNPCYKKGEQNG